jgi:parvulin-like peptidyl-prolyl isomerase
MEKSLGPERVNGGDLGFFSQGERPAEFDHVFTLDVGATSEVIRSPYGYHVFKLEKKLEGREVPYDEARPRILQLLAQKKGEEAYEKWLAGLKSRARVKINRKRLLS